MLGTKQALSFIGRGSIWVLLGVSLSKFFFLLSQILIVRGLGAEAYGILSFSVTSLAIISIFSKAGLDTGVRRYLPVSKEKKSILKLSTLLVLMLSVILSFVFLLIANLTGTSTVFKILMLGLPIYSLSILFLRSLEGLMIMKYRFWIEGLTFGVVLLCGVVIGLMLGGIVEVSLAYIAAYIAMLLPSLFILVKKSGNFLKAKISAKQSAEMMGYSWPMAFQNSLEIIIRHSNILIIGMLMQNMDVGIYTAAVNLAVISAIFLIIATPSFFPLASKMGKKSFKVYKELTKRLVIFSVPLFLIGFVFSDEIMRLFFGLSHGGDVLKILLIGYALEVVFGPLESYMNSLGYTKTVMLNMSAAAIVGVVCAFLLIPSFGIQGAALAYCIAVLVQKSTGFFEMFYFNLATK